jgi:hypothetical protein
MTVSLDHYLVVLILSLPVAVRLTVRVLLNSLNAIDPKAVRLLCRVILILSDVDFNMLSPRASEDCGFSFLRPIIWLERYGNILTQTLVEYILLPWVFPGKHDKHERILGLQSIGRSCRCSLGRSGRHGDSERGERGARSGNWEMVEAQGDGRKRRGRLNVRSCPNTLHRTAHGVH